MVLFKCSHPGCEFATTSAFNYCPYCGGALYIFEEERCLNIAINTTGPESRCRMAYQCEGMELYDPECENLEVRHNCIVGLWSMLESLEFEFRILRRAFEEAGVRVSPRTRKDLLERPTLKKHKAVPEP